MAIDTDIVLGLQKGIDEALREGLQITGPDVTAAARAWWRSLAILRLPAKRSRSRWRGFRQRGRN